MATILEHLWGGEVTPLSPRRQLNEIQLTSLHKELETLTSGMEITITYKPQLRMQHNSTNLTDITTKCLLSTLKRHNFSTILIGEYSQTGHYHMHGILLTNTGRTIDAIIRKLTKELGRIEIRQIKYTESYINYILKDTKQNRKIYDDEIIKISTKPL